MKAPKKKKSQEELDIIADAAGDEDNGKPIPFGALEALTTSDVIAEVKRGMSAVEPIDFEDEFNEEAA